MKYLVTGGAGFIGSALCHSLLSGRNADVVVIDKMTYAANPSTVSALSEYPTCEIIEADICDSSLMRSIVDQADPDCIFHLAAESHVDRSIDAAGAFVQTNIIGTYALLEAARAHFQTLAPSRAETFRFVHISTDEVFGSLGETGLFSETTAFDPSSPYSASKAGSDHLVSAWHRTYGLPTIISNCSNNYGPRQFPEKLIPLMILNALEGKPLPIYGAGQNVRDWLYVEDHVSALLALAERGRVGQTYTIGGNNEKSNLAVVETICVHLDSAFPDRAPHADMITYVEDRPGHDQRYAIDARKILAETGWAPKMSFDAGMKATIDWYLENEGWWRPLRDTAYRGERLGQPIVAS